MSENQELEEFAAKLFDFARAGDAQLMDYIERGVNVNMVNQEGQSFLMLAAYHGHADLVEKLLAAGADADLLNDRGQSPLAGAIFKKEEAVIEALIAAGASATAGQPTAIDTARMFGRADLVERLGAGG
ncbi:ankyrin repeat domain-containing protein [Corynebacterium flavescens]